MAICFLRGTRIATTTGERPVEEIAIGDLVVTVSGVAKPVKWIGHQHYKRAPGRAAWVKDVVPVRVRAGAIADGVPVRDLYVSQAHAFYLDGAMVEAIDLVNGASIVLEAPADLVAIDYFNIELDTHDVILAEGAEVETYCDYEGSRERFDNFFEYERLYGRSSVYPVPFAPRLGFVGGRSRVRSHVRRVFAPLVDRRTTFDRIQDRLAARAKTFALTE